MIFGYMRISTSDKQKTDRQKLILQEYSEKNNFIFDELIEEKISGTVKTDNRPEFKKLRSKLRNNDILVVTDIDRLGRTANDVIFQFKKLQQVGIRIVAIDTPYLNQWEKINDSSMYNMIADIFITLKAHIAEQEREKLVDRINAGLEVAKKKGKHLGRPSATVSDNFVKEYKKFKDGTYGNISATAFAKMLGIGRSTLYKYIKILNK